MNYYLYSCLAALCLFSSARAQKKVFGYPFQFEKSFLAKGQYSTYFLDNPTDSTFALILKDNKKAEYLWLGKDFKTIAKVSSPIENTLLDNQKHKYIGGTAGGGGYHFVYQTGTEFDMETVDFNAHAVADKKLLELPKSEKTLASFSDYNVYYCLTADDQAGNLVIYSVAADGTLTRREIPVSVPIPKLKLSGYLRDLSVIRSAEDPDLSSVAHINKLFSRQGELVFLLNVQYPHLRTLSIDTRDFSVKDNDIDETTVFGPQEKGAEGIFSFVKDNTIYSLSLDKKNIRVGVQRLSDGGMIGKYEFSDDAAFNSFAETPVRETRYIKEVDSKELDSWKKLLGGITYGGLPGCMVSVTANGKLLFTGGTIMQIGGSSGGGGMDHFMGGFDHNSTTAYSNGMVVPNFNPYMYRLPGTPSFVSAASSGTYYMSTYFRMLLDPVTLKPIKGQPSRPLIEQIRDFVYAKGKLKAPNQFSIGKTQYYGYYDEDTQQYVIEQIPIHG